MRLGRLAILGVLLGIAVAPTVVGAAPAPDGPGALSHFGLARKDCLGTARTTTSKVWYTVANGVLSDVYYPTVDTTNVETLQYIVTDGATFADLQTRDMTYSVQALDPGGMECRVTTTAKSGQYQIVTDYVTDPDRNTLLMRVSFQTHARGLKLYVRFDPSINGNGGGGGGGDNGGGDSATIDTSTGRPIPVMFDTATITNAVNRDYAQPVYVAMDASTSFGQIAVGFAGAASDGLVQLDASRTLTQLFTDASNGHVVATVEVSVPPNGTFTLALGFGSSQAEAVEAAHVSLDTGFQKVQKSYEAGWADYDASLQPPPSSLPGMKKKRVKELSDIYYLSANLVKAAEDKTFPGAIVKSLASPWGQSISAGDPSNMFFGSYREVFARDLYQAWTALVVAGDFETAGDAVSFLFGRQQQIDGSIPRNSLLNGKAASDTGGTQLDETAYAILMADQLGMTDASLYENHIKRAANFLIARGPAFGVERWDEQSGFSPSTIAAEIAGLVAAAHLAQANGDETSAQVFLGVADDYQRSVIGWTVTTTGHLATHPYFIRLSKTGDPGAAISYNLGNGGPTLDQRDVIDAGFLELSRLGIFPTTHAAIIGSLPVVDATIESMTPNGPGWHRYNGDGYGDGKDDGHPWAPTGRGTGHLWPVLTAERAAYTLQSGDQAAAAGLADTMARFAGGVGLIPEQDWELPDLAPSPLGTDPTVASIGFTAGQPAGSASPLTWSAAAFVRLLGDLGANQILEQPTTTTSRYIAHAQGQTTLTVTSPADQSAVDSSPMIVTGTTAPGNIVYVAAANTDDNFATTNGSAMAAADGTFSVSVPITGGTIIVNTVAVSPNGATAHDKRTIVFDFTAGTVLLDVTDPSGDDNGPGNYAYPTSSDFHAGAFDIQAFRVILAPDGSTVTFKLQLRDLSPTFGNSLGAQLIDVYVHDPNAAAGNTSTAASFLQRNYMIAPSSAWSRLLEVQGFGQRYIDVHGTTVGTISVSANAISRFVTFSVPTSSLGGQPGSGWHFVVVVTGQGRLFGGSGARLHTNSEPVFVRSLCDREQRPALYC